MTISTEEFIVFWKSNPGQQVHTVVDAHNQPFHRDFEYLRVNGVIPLTSEDEVLEVLEKADGTKYAVTPEVARATLGWDV